MATLDAFLDRLDEALAWELAGAIQYLQHRALLTGLEREPYAAFFHEGSEEARGHAELVAEKIAVYGRIPTVRPARVREATDLQGMAEAALALEEAALAAYVEAHTAGEDCDDVDDGTLFWLEEMIAHEQEHVDRMRKICGRVRYRRRGEDREAAA